VDYCEKCGGEQSKFLQNPDGKLPFSSLYGMYTITLFELKAVSTQAKHSDAVNKTSSESMAKDDDSGK
jgi:hypothetical protein